jgi:hypothetical protein
MSTPGLQALALRLADHDWDVAVEAAQSLERAGQAAIDAILWGRGHPDARVRRGCCRPGLRRLSGPRWRGAGAWHGSLTDLGAGERIRTADLPFTRSTA